MKESKSQSKQEDAKKVPHDCDEDGALLVKRALGLMLSWAGETPAVPANSKIKSSPSFEMVSGEPVPPILPFEAI
jgi:hypothetical protein